METIFNRKQISAAILDLAAEDVITSMEEGFVAYSQGKTEVPPVGELIFKDPPGEAHIKYGYIKGDDYYVIKIAAGFYENSRLGLPTNSGLMLIFSQQTGALVSILLDGGDLTNIRTAAAGAVAARYLAPARVKRIGILGTGCQARLQLEYLQAVADCREVMVWGRSTESLEAYVRSVAHLELHIQTTTDPALVAASCNLIVTVTPAKTPLLSAAWIRPGTHVTAIGSDTAEKQELDPEIIAKADLVVVDSMEQSRMRGEVFQARKADLVDDNAICELGKLITGRIPGRTAAHQITVADLTGVAVQDIQICKLLLHTLAPGTD